MNILIVYAAIIVTINHPTYVKGLVFTAMSKFFPALDLFERFRTLIGIGNLDSGFQ